MLGFWINKNFSLVCIEVIYTARPSFGAKSFTNSLKTVSDCIQTVCKWFCTKRSFCSINFQNCRMEFLGSGLQTIFHAKWWLREHKRKKTWLVLNLQSVKKYPIGNILHLGCCTPQFQCKDCCIWWFQHSKSEIKSVRVHFV